VFEDARSCEWVNTSTPPFVGRLVSLRNRTTKLILCQSSGKSASFVRLTAAATGSLSARSKDKQPPDEVHVFLRHRNYYHPHHHHQKQQQLKPRRADAEQKPTLADEQRTVSSQDGLANVSMN